MGMTRDQIIAKWNGMTSRERNAWVAEVVFGWRAEERPNGPHSEYTAWYWINAAGDVERPVNFFNPSRRIECAWKVADKSAEWGGMQIGCYGKPDARYYEVYTYTDTHPYSYPIDVTRETAPEAISLAAIIAKLPPAV